MTQAYETTKVDGNVKEVPLKSVMARYVRLVGIADSDIGFSISEFEVWSKKQTSSRSLSRQVLAESGTLLTDGWRLQNAMFTASTSEDISSPKFSESDWLPAVVPGTVLASYLAAAAIPDPFYGSQHAQISEEFFTRNDFWHRNSFVISSHCRGRRLRLIFEGINWKAEVYLNGVLLGDIAGSFIRTSFDITEVALYGAVNCVAVLIRKVAHPGEVQHKTLRRGYRNGGILGLDSPTFVSSIGWNWLPTIPGRNIGIWNDVRFEVSGDVVLVDPWVRTQLAQDNSRADLTVSTDVRNLSGELKTCTLFLSMDKLTFRKEVTLQPHETQSLSIDKTQCPELTVNNPRLWWPNGYGDADLHSIQVRIELDGIVSMEQSITFGIRTIEYQTDNGVLTVLVNGYKILCRGGNWGMEDGMLICDEEGYDLRVRMHRDMNLVMIRNWVGMVGRDAFYDACDRHGILIWDDFWLANPSDGPDPSDHAMFMSNALDKIRRARRHPSVAVYCGRNEGDPPPDLDAKLRDAVSSLDGTRYYISHSASGLVTGHGPYDNQDPEWYFENRGATFHTEQGIVCVPSVESMRAMMPESDLWPISDTWAVHDYQNPRSVLYTERIAKRYGPATGIEDYCRKAQMVNLESAKAMYECLQSNQGSAQLLWMTQSAWPALICQLYDYYFEQTAAYFGSKTACEPIHILWDQHRNVVKAANNTISARRGLRAEAWIYDLDGRERWRKAIDLDLPVTAAQICFSVEKSESLSPVFFVKLKLTEADVVLSENFYWSPAQVEDCTALSTLPNVNLSATIQFTTEGAEDKLIVAVTNPTSSVALAIRLKAVHSASGERILPAMYEDNYFSLLPNESKTVAIRTPNRSLSGKRPRMVVEGWNVRREVHDL